MAADAGDQAQAGSSRASLKALTACTGAPAWLFRLSAAAALSATRVAFCCVA